MKIISHRGYWNGIQEKNTYTAFQRSFLKGFGTETDIRDYCGELVISHDIATKSSLPLECFLALYNKYGMSLPLALNIKSDGLAKKLKEKLVKYKITNYFCFDMSIPDMLDYLDCDLNVYFRISEFEVESALLNRTAGIWLDGFNRNLITQKRLMQYLDRGLDIAIVSPDLHHRPAKKVWEEMKSYDAAVLTSERLMLCTDYPEKASEVLYEQEYQSRHF